MIDKRFWSRKELFMQLLYALEKKWSGDKNKFGLIIQYSRLIIHMLL